ncbi:MAG TPA: branched-chain amino acid ABC transporter permease [Chloroflexota bacterium]|nr:branched-chain amino acid ABC transporter permease [Chloroflexota bacterium]
MTFEIVAQTLISGLLTGFIFALVAVGLSLIFGMMEIVNFAHGEFLMLAMYASFWMWSLFGLDPLVSLPITVALMAILGVAVYRGLIKPILHAPMLAQIFATFGLAVFLRSAAQFLWTPNFRVVQNPIVGSDSRIDLGGIFIGGPQLVAALGAIVTFALIYWLVERTEVGRAMMATAEDRETAALMGIDSDKMFTLAWAIGAGCVGVAGALLANFYYIQPEVGVVFGLTTFVVVAMGGFGSIPGALIAGILVGLIQVIAGFVIDPAWKFAVVLAIYLLVVFVRPQGLLGEY